MVYKIILLYRDDEPSGDDQEIPRNLRLLLKNRETFNKDPKAFRFNGMN